MSNRTLRTGLSLVFTSMVLAGCASYSGLSTVGVSLDAKNLKATRSLEGITISPAAWPAKDWWKRLGDGQLDGLIEEALRDSPDMQIASARAHQASAAAGAADAARMPTLNAEADVSRSRLSRSQDPTGQGGGTTHCAMPVSRLTTHSICGVVSAMLGKQHWARPARPKSTARPQA